MKRARGVAQACGNRVSRFPAIRPDEPVKVTMNSAGDRLNFYFTNHHDACVEFSEIKPDGLANVVFGDEHVSEFYAAWARSARKSTTGTAWATWK